MLKQAFKKVKKIWKEFEPLSNIFSNRLNDLIYSSNKKDIIGHRQNGNAISLEQLATRKNRVVGPSKIEEKALERNKIVGGSKIDQEIENANGNKLNFGLFVEE